MTGIRSELRSVVNVMEGEKIKQKRSGAAWRHVLCSTFLERKMATWTQRGHVFCDNNCASGDMTCKLAASVIQLTLGCSATDATISISISNDHTSRLSGNPPPPPHFPTPNTMSPSSLLSSAFWLSLLVSLQCYYSNGEMWEYLRPSECRKRRGGGAGGGV